MQISALAGRGGRSLPYGILPRSFTKTLIKVMKLTFILLTVALCSVHAKGLSQNVSLAVRQVTLAEVFRKVEQSTQYVFLYKKEDLRNTKPVTIEVQDLPIEQFLEKLLADQSLEFTIKNHSVFITRKQVPDDPAYKPIIVFQEKPPVKGIIYNQSLIGNHNQPILEGASIRVKGTEKGTFSNAKGEFSIEAKPGDKLIISFVGFETQEVEVTGNLLVIQMKPTNSPLDQVQITAYGRTTRRLATGNIGTVKAEDIERQPVLTVQEALIGRVPGVTITPMAGNAAAPVMIQIRGRNSINPNMNGDPLYVVDGIPMVTLNASMINSNVPFNAGSVQAGLTHTLGENPLLGINPKDIASIDILKDADATAIYGSRGANGVILITTKRPKPGATSFNLNISNGFKSIQKFANYLSTEEYLAIRKEALEMDGLRPDKNNAPDLTVWDQQKYTDWQRYFGTTGNVFSVNASLTGGMAQTNYAISANHTSSQEIMNNGGKNNVSSLRSTVRHSSMDQRLLITGSTNFNMTDVESYRAIDISSIPPNAPDIYNDKMLFNIEPYRLANATLFPFSSLKRPSKSKTFGMQSSLEIRYELMQGLSASVTAGYQFSSNENSNLTPMASMDPKFASPPFSTAIFGSSINKLWSISPQLAFQKNFGRSNISAQLLGTMQAVETKGITTIAMMFPNDNMMKSANNAASIIPTEGYAENRISSAAAIIRYSWDNKYMISLNGRRDGSSRFGPGKRFGNFGSIGLAWIVSDEQWMQQVLPDWFSFFKLRGSYGVTGDDAAKDYEFLSRWTKDYVLGSSGALFPYGNVQAFHAARAMNQDFRWGSNKKTEAAIELGFLKDRINLSVSWYSNLAGNQLTDVAMPEYSGFPTVFANWPAEVENTGIEVEVSANLINTKDWSLTATFNISNNKNRVKSFPGLESTPYFNRYKVGQSLSTKYLYHYTGINPANGDYSFEDHNKDGIIYSGAGEIPVDAFDDRYIALDLNDKYRGGFGFLLKYKSISIGTQFSFANKMARDPYLELTIGRLGNMVVPEEIMNNHWRKPGDIVKYPRFTTQSLSSGINNSDAAFVNGSYLRWSNLSVNYQLPEKWTSKVKMKGASIGVSTQNLLTISNYKGLDPDMQTLTGFVPRTVMALLTFNF